MISTQKGELTLDENTQMLVAGYLVVALLIGLIVLFTSRRKFQGEAASAQDRLDSIEATLEKLQDTEELLEISAYDASRTATKLEAHLSAFNDILVKAQNLAAEERLSTLEEELKEEIQRKEIEELEALEPDIEKLSEKFHETLSRLVAAREDLTKIQEQMAYIMKTERDEQLEKITAMNEEYEDTLSKIDALEDLQKQRDDSKEESTIMDLLGSEDDLAGGLGNNDLDDLDYDGDEEEIEIYEDEDGTYYYIDPDTDEEVPCDDEGNPL
mgnify:CR=1 FL=1